MICASPRACTPPCQTYARPNKRPTKMEPIDYFSLSRRDGNMYRFGSQFQ